MLDLLAEFKAEIINEEEMDIEEEVRLKFVNCLDQYTVCTVNPLSIVVTSVTTDTNYSYPFNIYPNYYFMISAVSTLHAKA